METLHSLVSNVIEALFTHWTSLALGLVVITLYWHGTRTARGLEKLFPDLRGPKPWPFISNLPALAKARGQVHLLLDRFYREYPNDKVIRLSFISTPSLLIRHPDFIKAMFVKNFDCFHDRPTLAQLPTPLDKILSIVQGEDWRRIRSNLSPTFSAHKLKAMVPLMNIACDTLLQKIEKVAKTGETFDIMKYKTAVTLDIIISCAFGVQSECQTNSEDAVMKLATAAMNPSPLRAVIGNVIVPMLPGGKTLLSTRRGAGFFFESFFGLSDFVQQVMEKRNKEGSQRKDMLDLMLQAAKASDGKALKEDEIIANAIVFLLAGHDTTSTTLALTCHHLATNPEVQEKLQAEIDGVWSDEDKMPSYETVHELPYLEMVISETLRLCPPGFMVFRECTKSCEIEGLRIPKGTPIVVPAFSIHRDPTIYPEPEKFDPERFSAEAKQSRDPYAFLPFGHGPHNCIGMRFAQMEMKLVLVRILKHYSLRTTPETIIPAKFNCTQTLSLAHPVNVKVEKR